MRTTVEVGRGPSQLVLWPPQVVRRSNTVRRQRRCGDPPADPTERAHPLSTLQHQRALCRQEAKGEDKRLTGGNGQEDEIGKKELRRSPIPAKRAKTEGETEESGVRRLLAQTCSGR